jgi:hypothetical protein
MIAAASEELKEIEKANEVGKVMRQIEKENAVKKNELDQQR